MNYCEVEIYLELHIFTLHWTKKKGEIQAVSVTPLSIELIELTSTTSIVQDLAVTLVALRSTFNLFGCLQVLQSYLHCSWPPSTRPPNRDVFGARQHDARERSDCSTPSLILVLLHILGLCGDLGTLGATHKRTTLHSPAGSQQTRQTTSNRRTLVTSLHATSEEKVD